MDPQILAGVEPMAQALYKQQFANGIRNPGAVLAQREAMAMGGGGNPPNPAAAIPGGVQPPGMSQAGFSGYPGDPKAIRAQQRQELLMKLKMLDAQDAQQNPAPPQGQGAPVMPQLPMSQ